MIKGIPYGKLSIKADSDKLLYPDFIIENTRKGFALDHRNGWMINQASYVVPYVWKTWGSAYKFKTIAEKKTVINLYKEE